MSLMRSILVFGWIMVMAAYSSKQAIHTSFAVSAKWSKDLSYFFANDDAPYLFFQNSTKENVLKTAQSEPLLKWIIGNAQHIITTFTRSDFPVLLDFKAHRAFYISKIIFPFHYFW
jgi:hypothetical protein